MTSCTTKLRSVLDLDRMSIEKFVLLDITLLAPGHTRTSPTVHTSKPGRLRSLTESFDMMNYLSSGSDGIFTS